MNGLHFVGVAQDPLLVGVGGEVVGGRVMRCHVEEQVTELGRRVFRTVGTWTMFRIFKAVNTVTLYTVFGIRNWIRKGSVRGKSLDPKH
jgi:hypothetical protein